MLTPQKISLALKILDKDGNLIPFKWNALQKDFSLNRTGKDIILKGRQIGFTTFIQAEIFRNLISKTTRAITLSHIDTSTQLIRQIQDRFYENFPDDLDDVYKPVRKYSNDTITTYLDTDSTHFIGTAGNLNIGRGGTFSIFHGSEVAFWKDAEKIIAGALQAGNPEIVLESTPNGIGNYFYEICMKAISGKNDWKLHFYPWYKHPMYKIIDNNEIQLTSEEIEVQKKYGLSVEQLKWRRQKQQELGRFFLQEYPETVESCFLTSGNGFFSALDLSHTFEAPRNTERIPGHVYSAGIDFGQSNDFTFMMVIDRTDNRQVDYLHINKMPWNLQRAEIIKMYRKWGLTSVRAEANSIGEVNIEELENSGLVVERFVTSNSSKSLIMQKLYEALENGLKLIDWDVQKMELHSIESKQTPTGLWTVSAPNGLHDDTVIGLALAVTAKINKERKVRQWE